MDDIISASGSVLRIAASTCKRGDVEQQSIDLTPYQGRVVRVYLDDNLQIRINPNGDMFWQLAELTIPHPQSHQVQIGTMQVEKTESVIIIRGETDFDAVSDINGREIVAVGHYWQNFREGIEWQAEATGVRWIGERSPQTGEEYPVELKEILEEPHMLSEIILLDLEKIPVQKFKNPY